MESGDRPSEATQQEIREQLLDTARRQSQFVHGHASLTHLTGAIARGWWTPPLRRSMPACFAQTWAAQPSERLGVRTYRHREIPAFEIIAGLRVAPPAEILMTCARELNLLDMVVLLDGAARVGTDLREIAHAARRMRGAPALRAALVHADPRSESAWETLLRLFHRSIDVDVRPQAEILDRTGATIGWADLRLLGTPAIHEYDGGHHLSLEQQRDDLRRTRALTNAGWIRRGYTSHDLISGYGGVLRDCDLTLGRPADPRRLTHWEALLRESLFTPGGQYRLRRLQSLPRARFAKTEGAGPPGDTIRPGSPSVLAARTTRPPFGESA